MKLAILQLFLCLCIAVFPQIAKQLHVPIAGELSKILTADEKKTLQELTLTGSIDARDVKCLRDELVSLQKLDISNTTIEKYEGKNGTLPFNEYAVYQANELPSYSFNNFATGKATLKHIYLPNSITKIDQNAFKQCKNLAEITIPNAVISIGESAFSDCINLKQLAFSASLTRIESNAFSNCEQITTIKLPCSLEFIGKSAFRNCYNLTNVSFGKTKLTISESAFAFCSELKTVYCLSEFPPTVALTAFELTNIQTVFVPANVQTIYLKDSFWKKFKITLNQ
jgi:hypothetical protein